MTVPPYGPPLPSLSSQILSTTNLSSVARQSSSRCFRVRSFAFGIMAMWILSMLNMRMLSAPSRSGITASSMRMRDRAGCMAETMWRRMRMHALDANVSGLEAKEGRKGGGEVLRLPIRMVVQNKAEQIHIGVLDRLHLEKVMRHKAYPALHLLR